VLTEVRTGSSKTAICSDSLWKICGVTTIEQLQQLAPMGAMFWKELKMPGRFVPQQWIGSWQNLIAQGMAIVIGLMRDQTLMGAIGGVLAHDLNDGALVSVEQFWFVTPEARGRGLRLLDAFETASRLRGAQRIMVGHIHAGRDDLWHRVLARKGYVLLESHYIKC